MGLAKKRVRLHTKDGRTFEGLLIRRGAVYALELVDMLVGPGPDDQNVEIEKVQLDGQVRIERDNVSFFQVIS